jgi:hypothetical protein
MPGADGKPVKKEDSEFDAMNSIAMRDGIMSSREQDMLEMLKFELKFLEDGGYGSSPHSPWRVPYIFADSPTCLNFNTSAERQPCAQCILLRLVPYGLHNEEAPCRFIPLNDLGQTIDSLYRWGTQQETEELLGDWLRREIKRLEAERAEATRALS